MTIRDESRGRRNARSQHKAVRWECRCQEPPVLLGTYDESGHVNIKVRDRYWHVQGSSVHTVCPKCGAEHTLELPRGRDQPAIQVVATP
jgi:hypothetical protein